jgi:non-homologous end joining protein Ku
VEKLIAEKQEGRAIKAPPKTRRAPVVDLMEALKKSLKTTSKTTNAKGTRRHRAA